MNIEKASSELIPRSRLIRRAVTGFGSIAAGGAAAAQFASASGRRRLSRDRQVLEFALELERLQSAFYAHVLTAGKLTGEARQFAEIVGREERAHLHYLTAELGAPAKSSKQYRFGDAATSNAKFVRAAVTLEETGLAAYNGQTENLSRARLASVARVISVEARHAAWARGMVGRNPAPFAADVPISAAQAMKAISIYLG